jgi:low affinity Fe/Cu permease
MSDLIAFGMIGKVFSRFTNHDLRITIDPMIDKAYGKFANGVSNFVGSVWSLVLLLTGVIGSGLYADFSLPWERHIHLAMAFLALVAVFFLQRSQRHDTKATNLKLDELIRSLEGPRNNIAEVEKESEEVIDKMSSK